MCALMAALGCLAGCGSRTAMVSPRGESASKSGPELRNNLSATEFTKAIVGDWVSAWSRPSHRHVEELGVRSDGTARVVVAGDAGRLEASGPFELAFERPPAPNMITFAEIVIRPADGPSIKLSRVNFGWHNALPYGSGPGPFLRIDGNPVGELASVLKRAD